MTGVRRLIMAVVALLAVAAGPLAAARAADENPFEGLKFSAEAYLDWSRYETGDVTSNAFSLERGYLTVTKKHSDFLSFRYTLDVKQAASDRLSGTFEDSGEDEVDVSFSPKNALDGNYVFRTKYLFAEMSLGGSGAFTQLRGRIGMQHAGPDDFEQAMNPYRAQSRNWLERAGWFSTADLGVGLHGNFGGKLEGAKEKVGTTKYDGRRGSFQVLLANGGGYDKAEANENKLLSGRVTVRPLADQAPSLQLTYGGAFGKDNTANGEDGAGVDFNFHLFMLSWQSPRFTAYGQYFLADNNQSGKFVDAGKTEGVKTAGWSAFASFRPAAAEDRLAFFGRYSLFDGDRDEAITTGDHNVTLLTGGASYEIAKGNLFIVAYEVTSYDAYANKLGSLASDEEENLEDDRRFQVVYKLEF